MTIPGVEFQEAWDNRVLSEIAGVETAFISKDDLMKAKAAAGRPQDLLDLASLKRSNAIGESGP
jgi:hypothetical protein